MCEQSCVETHEVDLTTFCTPQPLLWGDAEHVATSIQILYKKIKILQVRQNSDHTCSPYHSIKKKTGISCIRYAGKSPVQIKSCMLNKIIIFFPDHQHHAVTRTFAFRCNLPHNKTKAVHTSFFLEVWRFFHSSHHQQPVK